MRRVNHVHTDTKHTIYTQTQSQKQRTASVDERVADAIAAPHGVAEHQRTGVALGRLEQIEQFAYDIPQ